MILGATQPPRYPIGHSDYKNLRRAGFTYIDKTRWVADILDNSAHVLLVPRPRRFGKTLNMTTLRAFLERSEDDTTDCFEDTALWHAKQGAYRAHFQRYPVLYLSFKDIKGDTWDTLWTRLRQELSEQLDGVLTQLSACGFVPTSPSETSWISRARQDGSPAVLSDFLRKASAWLHAATGQRLFLLIDEYDAPLHAAWQYGYWEEAVSFFRGFLSSGLKDNPHLQKGVLTGILKVSKEGIFSGLNHLQTASIVNDALVDRFGFTEDEVQALAESAGRSADLDAMRHWYNGYTFGDSIRTTLYNPWSILSYLHAPGSGPRPFWKNTSDNALIRDLMARHAASIGPMVEELLRGELVHATLDENVALPTLHRSARALPGLLTFSGYLTADTVVTNSDGAIDGALRIPNREVRTVFTDTFLGWLEDATPGTTSAGLTALSDAMLAGDTESFERQLGAILKAALSFMDFGHRPIEAIYQAFVVGLLVHLQDTHRVVSNREAGYGRADVLVMPRSKGPGAVLELKVIDTDYDETVQVALERAVTQLRQRDYAAEVRAAGATDVHQYAVVFDGKRCWMERVEVEPAP